MFKRPLAFTALLFSFGVLIAAFKPDLSTVLILAAVLSVFIFFKTGKTAVCILAVSVIFLGIARMNLAQLYRNSIVSEYGETTAVRELTITEFSEENKAIASFKDKGRTYKAYLTVKSKTELYPGDIVVGEITLRAPLESKTKFSGFSDYLAARGVYLTAYAENVSLKGRLGGSIMAKIYSLRVFMDKLGERCFSGSARALFNAMVFGDKRLISDELSANLQASGLNHIVVVSGMHLSVMIGAVMFLIHKSFGKGRVGYIFALLAAIFITLATGAGASVVRALIMCVMFLMSQLLYRENDSLTSLAFATFLMIIINPFIVFNAGFILSVLSVLGILIYNGKISLFLEKFLPKYAAQTISLSISAQLTVTPALVYYFGIITPYSLISNLLLVSLSGVYVIAGIVFILLSWAGPLSLFIRHALKLMSMGIESVCYYISLLPGAILNIVTSYEVFFLTWLCILILIYVYPKDVKTRFRIRAIFAAAILSVNFFARDNAMSVQTFYYGGQTMTSTALSSGEAILIDCPDIYDLQQLENSLTPYRYAVISTDSYGQLLDSKSNVKTVVALESLFTDETKKVFLEKAKSIGVRVKFTEASKKVRAGDAVIEYFPAEGIDGGYGIRLEYRGKTLITLQGLSSGDILKLYKEKTCFVCDYLVLPFTVFWGEADVGRLCTGEVVTNSK